MHNQVTTSVKPYEKIKVRLLNGGHLALGYAGVLAGFDTVCNVTSDRTFQRYLRGFFRQVEETLEPVPQMDLSEYQESLVSRFTNPAIGDHLERICKDGSAKIPGFILAALRELLASHKPTSHVSFVLASYMRYLTVLVGRGEEADDPQSDSLLALAASADGKAQVFLSDELLFGDIGQNQALVREVQSHYDSICSKGMMVSLQELNGSE